MTYVVSNIHGCYADFTALLKEINFSKNDVMFVLGDVVDIGDDPIELVCDLSMRENVWPVAGEHDKLAAEMLEGFSEMLKEGKTPDAAFIAKMQKWVAMGGQRTLDGFRELDEDMREGVLDYLGELMLYDEVAVKGKTYFMLNGGIANFDADTDPEEYAPEDFAAVKLDMNKEYYSDKIMITANAEQGVYDKITQRANNICIGCETAACLRLEDGEKFYA